MQTPKKFSSFSDQVSWISDEKGVGTSFEEIVSLYKFDAELRELFFKYLLQIERQMRSLMSHYFTEMYGAVSLPQSGNQYEKGKQDLFAVVIAFRYLLPGKDFLEFKRKLIKEIDRVNREVEHISEVELLNKMVFSENWKSITKYHLK